MPIPDSLLQTILANFSGGQQWLDELPGRLHAIASRWELTLQPPFPNLTYSYVAPVIRVDGTHAVLKLGIPDAEFKAGIAALQLYDGQGAVRLLERDAEAGAALLEHVHPGEMLNRLADDRVATSIAAGVMQRL